MLKLSYAVDDSGLLAESVPEGALVLWNTPGVLRQQDLASQLVLMVRKAVDVKGRSVPVVVISDESSAIMLPLYTSQIASVVSNSFAEYVAHAPRSDYADFVTGLYQQSPCQINPAVAINAVYEWSRDAVNVPKDIAGQSVLRDWLNSIRAQFSRAMYVLHNADLCASTKMDWKSLAASGIVL